MANSRSLVKKSIFTSFYASGMCQRRNRTRWTILHRSGRNRRNPKSSQMKILVFLLKTAFKANTLFENHQKCRIFKKLAKIDHFWHFNELLSTQNVNVARFARNVECDFLGDFQTLCEAVSIRANN